MWEVDSVGRTSAAQQDVRLVLDSVVELKMGPDATCTERRVLDALPRLLLSNPKDSAFWLSLFVGHVESYTLVNILIFLIVRLKGRVFLGVYTGSICSLGMQ